jgi:hypothetical protein
VPSGGKNLTEITSTFSTGYETAAKYCSGGKAEAAPALTLVEFPIEQN